VKGLGACRSQSRTEGHGREEEVGMRGEIVSGGRGM